MSAADDPHRQNRSDGDRVLQLESCRLAVEPGGWDFATTHAPAIDANWQRRSADNPAMFNGTIHLLRSSHHDGGHFEGRLVRSDFKSYLLWRDQNFPPAGVQDAFGSALIRSCEGHVLLGRQRAGNLNAGQAYLPGGFIDPRDVDASGAIDIDGSIERELREETGFDAGDFTMRPGYILTFAGALVSFAREFDFALDSESIRARIRAHIAADPEAELVDAVIVRSAADLETVSMPAYARLLLGWLFSGRA